MKMLLFVIFVSLFVECAMQEFGEVQQLIGLVFGNQMNSMMSSCCVIRELQCPVQRQYRPASYHNASADFSRGLESFSRCVCTNNTQCVLTLPPSFLPDRADGVKFDVTFVTASTTTQYTCTYNGTRALVCQYRQSMRTETLSWVMPHFTGRGYGTLQAMSNAGLLGEEMEEAMEQMVESGIPHIQAPRPNSQCRRCAPLQCGVTVSREAQRLRLMMRRTSLRRTSLPAVRRRYHQCLLQNSIRPPVPEDPVTTTTLPPSTFPLILPLTPPPDPTTLPPPPTPKPTTRRTTITITTRKTTKRPTTTTKRPTTKRTTPKPVIVTTPKPAPPVVQITTPENLTTKPVPIATTTPAVEVTTKTSVTPSTTSATTTTPQEFTRILVGSDSGTTSAPSTQDAVKDLTETREGGSTSLGGGRIAGVIIGIVVAAAVVFIWLFFLFRRRRRRRKHREVEVSVNPVVAGKHTSSGGVLGSKLHYKARPLPTVSSRKAVIDAVDADDQFEKSDDDDDDDDSEVENPPNKARAERYTTPPSSRKSSLATKQSFRDDDSQHYASLDELAITSTQNTLPINVISVTAASGVVGSAPATGGDSAKRSSKESGKYYNMEGVATAKNVTGQSSSSSGDASKRPTKESKKYFNMDGTDSAKGDTGSGGSDKYYNLKPGAAPPRPGAAYTEVTLSSDTGNVNYVNTTSPSASLYETPRLQPSQSHLYTSLKIKGKPSNASIKSNSSTVSRTESDPNYVKASVTFQSPRGGDVYSEPYGSVRANNGRPGIGDQSQGSNNSSRTTASQEGSKPPTPTSTSPKVDNDGYLLPVTPRKQQRL